jgi:hypothetical protein
MAEPFAGPGGMAMGINSHPPPATSSRWVGQGRIRRNLFNYVNWLRKKKFSEGIYFILFFNLLKLEHPQNGQIVPPLRSPTVVPRVPSFPCCARMFLVGCCVLFVVWRPRKATTYFILLIFLSINSAAEATPRRSPDAGKRKPDGSQPAHTCRGAAAQ